MIAPRFNHAATKKGSPTAISTNAPPIKAPTIMPTFHNRFSVPNTQPRSSTAVESETRQGVNVDNDHAAQAPSTPKV